MSGDAQNRRRQAAERRLRRLGGRDGRETHKGSESGTFQTPWSFSFSISPSNEHSGLIFFRMDWLDLSALQGIFEFSPKPQFKSINSLALSCLYSPVLTFIHDYSIVQLAHPYIHEKPEF